MKKSVYSRRTLGNFKTSLKIERNLRGGFLKLQRQRWRNTSTSKYQIIVTFRNWRNSYSTLISHFSKQATFDLVNGSVPDALKRIEEFFKDELNPTILFSFLIDGLKMKYEDGNGASKIINIVMTKRLIDELEWPASRWVEISLKFHFICFKS